MVENPDELGEARQNQLDDLIAMRSAAHVRVSLGRRTRARKYRAGEQAVVFEALALWQSWWRDVLTVAAGCPDQVVHIDRRDDVEQAARRYRFAEIRAS